MTNGVQVHEHRLQEHRLQEHRPPLRVGLNRAKLLSAAAGGAASNHLQFNSTPTVVCSSLSRVKFAPAPMAAAAEGDFEDVDMEAGGKQSLLGSKK